MKSPLTIIIFYLSLLSDLFSVPTDFANSEVFLKLFQDTPTLDPPTTSLNVLDKITIVSVDSDSTDPIDKIIQNNKFERMTLKAGKVPNFGFSNKVFYGLIRFSETLKRELVLELDYPPMDVFNARCYSNNGELLKEIKTGDHVSFAEWEIKFRKPSVYLPKSTNYCWLIAKGANSIQFPLVLFELEDFNQSVLKDSVVQALYYGALLSILLYNFILFLNTRMSSYFFYILFLVSYGLFQSAFYGFGHTVLWENANTIWKDKATVFFISCVGMTSYAFAYKLLDLKSRYPKYAKILLITMGLHSPHLVALWFISYKAGIYWVFTLAFVWSLFLIILSSLLAYKGNRLARLYLIAWIVFILGTMINMFGVLGILDKNIFTTYAQQIGSTVEFILLSIALAYRINLMQENLNKSLERKVVDRTTYINEQRERAENLSKFSLMMNEESELDLILKRFLVYFENNFSVDGVALGLYEEETKEITFPYSSAPIGERKAKVEYLNSVTLHTEKHRDSILIKAFKLGKSIAFLDLQRFFKKLPNIDKMLVSELEIKRVYIHPLVSQNEKFGLILLAQYSESNLLTKENINKLLPYLSQITGILYGAHLRKKADSSRTLAERALKELQTSQEQLVQSEKMAALGQLIAGVAHEINTPLGAIRASIGNLETALTDALLEYPQILKKMNPKVEEQFNSVIHRAKKEKKYLSTKEERTIRKEISGLLESYNITNYKSISDTLVDMGIYNDIESYLELIQMDSGKALKIAYAISGFQFKSKNIEIAVEKAAKIVFALKNYSHFDNSEKKSVMKLEEGIETVLTIYQNAFKKGVELKTEFSDTPPISCHADELNQVFTNLIQNSIQAMNYSGKITIRTFEENNVDPNTNLVESFVVVQVEDDGPGIPKEFQEKVFDPFYTTKKRGEGSGLGLHICKKIIDKHNGAIDLYSEPGRTLFSIKLPNLTTEGNDQ